MNNILEKRQNDIKKEICCGTCARWKTRPGDFGLIEKFCLLDGKKRFKNEMKGCLGWKKNKV